MEILVRMEVRTIEPYSPREKKDESVIKIIKGKYKRRSVKRNVPKRVGDFGIIWETEIYYHTAVKDGRPALKRLTGDSIDIFEWLKI